MVTEAVIVEADGGSRGNPGPAGYGAVVFAADHAQVLAERKEFLGKTTNNVAEYRGLIAGLEAAAELGARRVDVRMDSKLVVEQMSGRWKVKHEAMIPLADRARRLVAGFDRVTFTWIPRKENKHADRLANEAMDDAHTVAEVRTALAEEATTTRTTETGGMAESVSLTDDSASRSLSEEAPTARIADAEESAPTPADTGSMAESVSLGDDSASRTVTGDATTAGAGAPGWTGAVGRPTRLLLLRHGQTELSVERRYSGRGNPALTELGREQAARAAERLAVKGGIAAIVSSPLGRARETAEAAGRALGVPVRVLDGLIETDFGAWEGMTFTEARERDPELHAQWLGDPAVPAPGGESFDQVRERIEGVRRDLVALYPGANVLVVSHVTPIKTILQLALGVGPSLLYRLHLDLASLSIAEFYPDGGSSVRLVNDTSYL
ncbi:bifunctional RNase H/acid phosphatase [Nocardia sp. NPDC020380]|uniref:bifunctional RNase H/acid phosphatase n=1 Tax=Nocardia sp. NPDC020380 TaxID=3364309 RepID=UPI00378C09E9